LKKVLVLTYEFPPYISVAGLRPYSWYQYLKAYGVHPIIVTRQWSEQNVDGDASYVAASPFSETRTEQSDIGTIVMAPYFPSLANKLLLKYGPNKYTFLRKFISLFYETAQWFLPVGTKLPLYSAADAYLSEHRVDCIIATGDPFILFKYASKLSKKHNTPWIADYRDLWSQGIPNNNLSIYVKWIEFLEKKITTQVDAVITVSTFLMLNLKKLIGNKDFYILPNGYDQEAILKASQIKQKDNILSIAYAGTIYKYHPIKNFLTGFSEFVLKNNHPNIELLFYGINTAQDLQQMIDEDFPSLKSYCHIFPKLSNEKLLEKLSESNIMLLFNDYLFASTKIYDYMAIKRKIVLCYSDEPEAAILKEKYYYSFGDIESDDDQAQSTLIKQTNSGCIVKDSHHLLNVLGELYREFEETHTIASHSINTEQFSRKLQVKKLADIIQNISK
jgi:glycosyltransferase involved in cell wall biosynthesis